MAGKIATAYTNRAGMVYKRENALLEQVSKYASSTNDIDVVYPVKQVTGVDSTTGLYGVDLVADATEQPYGLVTDENYGRTVLGSTTYDIIRQGQILVTAGGTIAVGADVKWNATTKKYVAHGGGSDTDLVVGKAKTAGVSAGLFVLEVNFLAK